MALTTKLRYGLARLLMKSADMAFVSEWVKTSFLEPSFARLTSEGYHANAAVYQCVSALAFGYPEPKPIVRDRDDEPIDNHPLQLLLNRPNPVMSHAELMTYIIIYKAIGGNVYLHKVRNRGGAVAELWPYHAGQCWPVPSRYDWVSEYAFETPGGGEPRKVPAADVIHLKWPSVDLQQPWMALPPLRAVAREVDTDSEMTRYLYALLRNDATPRTLLNIKTTLNDQQFERLRAQFSLRHGGDNRGGVGVVEGDATVSRMSMNLQELAFETLRRVPESRIAGAFRVPAILAGLYVGLEKSTYSNYREARQQLTEDTFVPMWKADGTELTQALAPEFGGDITVEYDIGNVAALQENEDAKYTRIIAAYDSGIATKNEARLYLGLPRVGDLQLLDEGDQFKGSAGQPTQPLVDPTIIDVTPQPAQLTDGKHLVEVPPGMVPSFIRMEDVKATQAIEIKARQQRRIEAIRERMQAAAAAKITADIEGALP